MVANLHWKYRDDRGGLATDRSSIPYGVTCYNCHSHGRSLLKIRTDMKSGLENLMQIVDLFKEVVSHDEHSRLMNLYVGCIADKPAEARNAEHRPQCSAHYFMGIAYLVVLDEFRKVVRQTVEEQFLDGQIDVQIMGDFDPSYDIWKFAAKYQGNSIDLVTYTIQAKKTSNKKKPIEIKKTVPVLFEGTEETIEDKIKKFFG